MRLTKKQKILLDFIEAFIDDKGYSPTYREIMKALGYKSVSTVAKHVDNLVALGALVKKDGEVRSLIIVKPDAQSKVDLVAEINKRQNLDDETAKRELEILQQALKITQS